jgi:hypothetical protein
VAFFRGAVPDGPTDRRVFSTPMSLVLTLEHVFVVVGVVGVVVVIRACNNSGTLPSAGRRVVHARLHF